MQLTHTNSMPYKKTSILINEGNPKVPKLDSSKFQKKHSCSQISPHHNINQICSGLPTINTVVSTSNLSTASFSFSEEMVRRIAREEVSALSEEIGKNNLNFNIQLQKMQTNVESIWKSVQRSLEDNSINIQKQTSNKLEIILGGIKKAMIEIQKQIKAEVMNEVISLPAYQNKRFKDITEKVNRISEHVFRVPYQRQKPSQIANQMKEITKQIQVFSQCNMTLFNQLNKIKTTVTSLSVSKPPRPPSSQSSSCSSINSFRPKSAASSNLQFKNKIKSKASFKQNEVKLEGRRSTKASPTISFSHIPSVANLSHENVLKSKDQMNQTSLTYQVDTQGRLLDSHGHYLLTEQGQHVVVEQQHINQLRRCNMLIE